MVVTQNDRDVNLLKIRVFNGNEELNYTQISRGEIYFEKRDKHVVQGDLNKVTDGFTYQMGTNEIACAGEVLAIIHLYGSSNERLATSKFKFEVERDLENENAIKSSSQYGALQKIIVEFNEAFSDIINGISEEIPEIIHARTDDVRNITFENLKARLNQDSQDIQNNTNQINAISTEVMNTLSKASQQLSNTNRIKTIDAPVSSYIDVTITGKMPVNLLGRDGNCEDVSKWAAYRSTVELDSSNKVFGSNGIKITRTLTEGTTSSARKLNFSVSLGKLYFISGYIKNGTVTNGAFLSIASPDANYAHSSYITESSRFQRTGCKLQANDNIMNINLAIWADGSNLGQYAYFDGIMLIEITEEEYNTLTVDQLLAKYPYVDSAQPLQNPAIEVRGKNLFDGRLEAGVLDTATGIEGTDSVRVRTKSFISIKSNTYYSFKAYGGQCGQIVALFYDSDRRFIISVFANLNEINNILSPENACYVRLRLGHVSTDVQTELLKLNAQIEEGTVATAYEPFRKTQSIIPTMLGKIGSYEDELKLENGVVKKIKRIEKKVLDGSLSWTFGATFTGYKRVHLASFGGLPANNFNSIMQKYDGKILPIFTTGYPTSADGYVCNADPLIAITISNTDSGWGDSYTPTVDEIKAYFMGWKMGVEGAGRTNPYNGSGNKVWIKVTRMNDAVTLTSPDIVSVLPTTPSGTDLQGNIYTPYQLYYALSTPVEEIINPIGELPLLEEGINHVEIGSGRVYERANIKQRGAASEWAFNLIGHPNYIGLDTPQSYKVDRFLKLEKVVGSVKTNDLQNWIRYTAMNMYGKEAYFTNTTFDAKAQYYVEYELLHEEYDSQIFEATIRYNQNLRTTVNQIGDTLSNVSKSVNNAWLALMPVADKELAMRRVALLMTETNADLKNKLNEILNIWRR